MKHYLTIVLLLALYYNASSQNDTYILNGAAHQDKCNCYTLTPFITDQSGSVWNKNKIDLHESFDFVFNVNLGCQDSAGADGIVFILQTVSASVGRTGSGLGFAGVNPSIGIELDTWQNVNTAVSIDDLNDPYYDHISILKNGIVRHGNDLAGPVPASATSDNIEDCQWHLFRIQWNAATKKLSAYFDNSLRVSATVDLVQDIFQNDPLVYWGFSGATGGSYNIQKFCTALNPVFQSNLSKDTFCTRTSTQFTDQSESFAPLASYFWDFGDGTTSSLSNPPPHTFDKPGIYTVKHAITAKDGCQSDTLSKTIYYGSIPVANFDVFDTCNGSPPLIVNNSTNEVGALTTWNWKLNGTPLPMKNAAPLFTTAVVGKNVLELEAGSEYGCLSAPLEKSFKVKPAPLIQTQFSDGCVEVPVSFTTASINAYPVTQWHWDFGDMQAAQTQNASHVFKDKGLYEVRSWAVGPNGCASPINKKNVFINKPTAFAGRDTMVLKNIPFQLNGSGNGSYQWNPVFGLDNDRIADPTGILTADQTYELTVTTPEGCIAKDTIKIMVFKEAAVFVPNAFTPNGDGKNDRLKPAYVGIKSLAYFRIYNRWGQPVFSTTNMGQEWDGTISGNKEPTGTYIWLIQAEDRFGHTFQLKGTVVLIR